MNAKQLRNSILQLAIQGKLVPQDPNDEPASVLLDKIRAEKKRLVKEGVLKKKDLKETPISEDEKPFEIPEGWEWVRIGNIFQTSSGTTPSSKNASYYQNGTINWVRTTDLNNGILTSCEIKVTEKAKGDCNLKFIPRDSVCIAMYGGAGTIGKNSIIKFDTTINQSVCAIHPNALCSMSFVLFFMQYQRAYWMDFAAGSRKDPNINQIIVKNCIFPLPPLAEQHRIVAKLEEILPIVDEYGKAQEEANNLQAELPDKLRKSILQEAIQGKLVPQDPNDEPASVLLDKIRAEKKRLVKEGVLKKKDLVETPISDDEKPFEIPEGWEWCRVKDLFNVWSARRVHEKDWRKNGIPFYRAREIGKLAEFGEVDNELFIDKFLYEDFSNSGLPYKGDLMITAVGTLGKVYPVQNDDPFYFKDGSVLCFTNFMQLNPLFYKLAIESPMFINQYKSESQGTTVATLTIVRANNYILPLPPLSEQHRIVSRIEEMFKAIDHLESKKA